jgi:hypothetical protein
MQRQQNLRSIEIGPQGGARQRIKQQIRPKWSLKKRDRSSKIFGWIKQELGFRRWTVRGFENVRTQWAMLCTTINLRVLYRQWLSGTLFQNPEMVQ